MKQTQKPATFEVQIDGYRNHTWQGKVILADGQVAAFQSDLELLKIISQWMEKDVEIPCMWSSTT